MGITQHKHSLDTVREITNLQLLGGHLGKLARVYARYAATVMCRATARWALMRSPRQHCWTASPAISILSPPARGHHTVDAIQAMLRDEVKVLIALGGNLAAAAPDTPLTCDALRRCGLTVYISTKLNRSHLMPGKQSLILPTLGRTEEDMQATGRQFVTVEDSFSMVHASEGDR